MNTERDNWKDLTSADATAAELRLVHLIHGQKPTWLDDHNWRLNMRECAKAIREHVQIASGLATAPLPGLPILPTSPLLSNRPGDQCPDCGAQEVASYTPWTVYACGSQDYDQRPGTFRKGVACPSKAIPEIKLEQPVVQESRPVYSYPPVVPTACPQGWLARFLSRFTGRVYGTYSEYHGERCHAHLKAEWVYPDHFAHNNYQRGHLPQMCIKASGWKARLLALVFWPECPWSRD